MNSNDETYENINRENHPSSDEEIDWQEKYDSLIEKTEINDIKENEQELRGLSVGLKTIGTAYIAFISTFVSILLTSLLDSKLGQKFVKNFINRALTLRHYIIQLQKKLSFDELPSFVNFLENNFKRYEDKIKIIWEKELENYVKKLETDANINVD